MTAGFGICQEDAFALEPALWIYLAQIEEVVNAGLDRKHNTVQQFLSPAKIERPQIARNRNFGLLTYRWVDVRLLSFLVLEVAGLWCGLHQVLIHTR